MKETCQCYVAIVDDDESVCRSLARLLHTAGYHTVAYPSGESFLHDTKRPRFDCLILDVQLPGISGPELRQRLALVNDATPVIFVTALDDPELRDEVIASGCAGYFSKNDPGAEILTAIDLALTPVGPTSPQFNQSDSSQ